MSKTLNTANLPSGLNNNNESPRKSRVITEFRKEYNKVVQRLVTQGGRISVDEQRNLAQFKNLD